jgi:hypothetical protein
MYIRPDKSKTKHCARRICVVYIMGANANIIKAWPLRSRARGSSLKSQVAMALEVAGRQPAPWRPGLQQHVSREEGMQRSSPNSTEAMLTSPSSSISFAPSSCGPFPPPTKSQQKSGTLTSKPATPRTRTSRSRCSHGAETVTRGATS